MPNMKSIITAHNKTVLAKNLEKVNPGENQCNCRKKDSCPLSGKCLSENIIYKASVIRSDDNREETYVGLTANSFKSRLGNHTKSFKNAIYRNSTELSKYIWQLKDSKIDFSIKWSIIQRCKPYSNISKKCNLCLCEKFIIICHPEECTLNRRSELVSTCRHRKKYLLCNYR